MLGGAPSTMSASTRAVIGPSVMPIIACPVPTKRPGVDGTAPITGMPSDVHGR
jgi:hypothetical protein